MTHELNEYLYHLPTHSRSYRNAVSAVSKPFSIDFFLRSLMSNEPSFRVNFSVVFLTFCADGLPATQPLLVVNGGVGFSVVAEFIWRVERRALKFN